MTDVDRSFDVAVIGGGLVGAAIAYGLAGRVARLAVLDEGDIAYRASRGNFGLVWVQSKGQGMPAYGVWTLGSAQAWPRLAAELLASTGIDVRLEQPGGLSVLLSEREVNRASTTCGACWRNPACRNTSGDFSTGSSFAISCRASDPLSSGLCIAATTATSIR